MSVTLASKVRVASLVPPGQQVWQDHKVIVVKLVLWDLLGHRVLQARQETQDLKVHLVKGETMEHKVPRDL